MIYVNDKALERFRRADRCEWCYQWSAVLLDPHHCFQKRGMGGGSRLDIGINLMSLCRWCHESAEQGYLDRGRMLTKVAEREKCRQMDIDVVLRFILQQDKDASSEQLLKAAGELKGCAAKLARRVLKEIGK